MYEVKSSVEHDENFHWLGTEAGCVRELEVGDII